MEASLNNSRRGRPQSDKRLAVVTAARQYLDPEHPMTCRHLFYLLVWDGTLQNKDEDYQKLLKWMVAARMEGEIYFSSIVDGIRESIKPSSWTGLEDFTETVRDAYRKDLWQRQSDYIEFWFEKDAIIGVVEDITRRYDIRIRPLRGQSSLTFLYEAASEFSRIEKPIFVYYFGDHDPSGYSIEDSARERMEELLKRVFDGCRRVVEYGLEDFPKEYEPSKYPMDEIRERVENAILAHIDADEWAALQKTEELERESFNAAMAVFKSPTNPPSEAV